MGIQNCWDVKQCGRQPGGSLVNELGICPATIEGRLDGINGGANAGRCCWAIVGTLCGGKVQGTFAFKVASCMKCEFYNQVLQEEGSRMVSIREIIDRLK